MADETPKPAKDRVLDFIAKVNKNYEGSVMEVGGKFGALSMRRFSSGVLDLDVALGGGWPFGRLAIVAGDYSTGKTLLALKACAEVEEYDHNTRIHKSLLPEGADFEPGTALFIDLEGSFDPDWAAKNGFNEERHVVARPDSAEQAIDIVDAAIEENVFDLIVIDSIAAMTPTKEITETTEKWQMGLAARLVNKAMRKWGASLNKLSQKTQAGGPLILCLNQIRIDLNAGLFADPRTLPAGKGQIFYASIIIYTKGAKIEDGAGKETETALLGGVTRKNKTYIPKVNFEYRLGLKDGDKLAAGELDNTKRLIDLGKKYGLLVVEKKGVTFNGETLPTQKAWAERLDSDPKCRRILWRSICAQAVAT